MHKWGRAGGPRNRSSCTFNVLKPMSFQGAEPPGPLLRELPLDPTRYPFVNQISIILYLVLLLGMIMILAYAGGGGHHFFVYPKGWVITFLVSTKGGGSCVFARCFAGSYRPPPVEIMSGP